MAAESFPLGDVGSLAEAFPDVDPNAVPLGARVLVQIRRGIKKTRGGLILVEETKETAKWNDQVAKVVAMGPIAYRNRETAESWPEGTWVAVGDYVRVPRWGGDRIEIPVKDPRSDRVEAVDQITFVIFNDHEIIARIPGDPLAVKAYVL